MSGTNCDLLHKEYKELKQKINEVIKNSAKLKPYSFIDCKDTRRMGEIATELVIRHPDYIKNLSASDRFELENDPAVDNIKSANHNNFFPTTYP